MLHQAPRLIDLHIDWLIQYAPETDLYGAETASMVKPFLSQAEGYLSATSAAVIALHRSEKDWQNQSDPWRSLRELIARVEAEFSGRILISSDDVVRWRDDSDGLSWAVLGIAGLDALIRSNQDLTHLEPLFERGVRVYQPISGPKSLLGGSASSTDDRGLSDLGRAFLESLLECARTQSGPRPALDLAHVNPRTLNDILDWFEADPTRPERMIPIHSHSTMVDGERTQPGSFPLDSLERLRRLRGWVGLTASSPCQSDPTSLLRLIDQISATPFGERVGFEGICIGTNLLRLDSPMPCLGNAAEIRDWLQSHLPDGAARAIIHDNAAALFESLAGRSGLQEQHG